MPVPLGIGTELLELVSTSPPFVADVVEVFDVDDDVEVLAAKPLRLHRNTYVLLCVLELELLSTFVF